MSGFDLREMGVDDIPATVSIVGEHNETDGRLASAYFVSFFAKGDRSTRERLYVGTDSATGIVAGVGGYAPDKYDWADVLWLNWLYVANAYKRRGLGWQLLNRIAEDARQLGIRKLYLDTSSYHSYQPAIVMYERFGFREEGRLVDYYEPGEHLLIMGADLPLMSEPTNREELSGR